MREVEKAIKEYRQSYIELKKQVETVVRRGRASDLAELNRRGVRYVSDFRWLKEEFLIDCPTSFLTSTESFNQNEILEAEEVNTDCL